MGGIDIPRKVLKDFFECFVAQLAPRGIIEISAFV